MIDLHTALPSQLMCYQLLQFRIIQIRIQFLAVLQDVQPDLRLHGMHQNNARRILNHYIAVLSHMDIGRRAIIDLLQRNVKEQRASPALRAQAEIIGSALIRVDSGILKDSAAAHVPAECE